MHAEEVIGEVMEFLRTKAGYPFAHLEKIAFDSTTSEWEVTVDVGVYLEDIKKVKVDDKDGRIIGFE